LESLRILATSSINEGAVMLEEKVGQGCIVALDLLSINRPYFNLISHRSATSLWM
jgi:hypothetical protein